jgi:glycosyltransferase involved in cell wall biosynthesis
VELGAALEAPASHPDALVEALARLIDDGEMRSRLGSTGRARALEHYDLARNVEALAAISCRTNLESGSAG